MPFLKVIDADWISKPGSGPCLPSQDVRHVEADRKARAKWNRGNVSSGNGHIPLVTMFWFTIQALIPETSWMVWLFDFDVVTEISDCRATHFWFRSIPPSSQNGKWSRLFFCYCIFIHLWSFKMETENAADVEEILAWKMIIFCFHLQIQGCTYLFFFFFGWRVTTGGLKWLWVGTIPILALVAGFPALCPGAELLTVSGVWSNQGILTFLGRNLQYMRHLPGS